jgi:hypothetical protein
VETSGASEFSCRSPAPSSPCTEVCVLLSVANTLFKVNGYRDGTLVISPDTCGTLHPTAHMHTHAHVPHDAPHTVCYKLDKRKCHIFRRYLTTRDSRWGGVGRTWPAVYSDTRWRLFSSSPHPSLSVCVDPVCTAP